MHWRPTLDTPILALPRRPIDPDALATLCRRHHIERLSVSSSVAKGTVGPYSDIDLLVELVEGPTPGMLGLRAIAQLKVA